MNARIHKRKKSDARTGRGSIRFKARPAPEGGNHVARERSAIRNNEGKSVIARQSRCAKEKIQERTSLKRRLDFKELSVRARGHSSRKGHSGSRE
jgi:hypothetical protein